MRSNARYEKDFLSLKREKRNHKYKLELEQEDDEDFFDKEDENYIIITLLPFYLDCEDLLLYAINEEALLD